MFGLEKKDSERVDFSYDLEKDLRDPKKHTQIKEQVEARVSRLKELLRQGEDKENFNKLGALLHGYISMKKIMERSVNSK